MNAGDRTINRGLLAKHAEEIHDRWYFTDGGTHGHTFEDALLIVEACRYLDAPITDRMTIKTWTNLVTKVRELEALMKGINDG